MKKTLQILLVLASLFLFAIRSHADEPVLAINGDVKTPLNLTLTDIEAMKPVTVTAKDHDSSTAQYVGVPLPDILSKAGVPQGPSLRGDAMQLCVLVKATDNYKVVFSLPELDPSFTDKLVLLAYQRNGKALDAKTGPLLLVVPDDKRYGRWVRQVTDLEIVRVNSTAKP